MTTLIGGLQTFRAGLDETSPAAGLSLKKSRYKLDAAFVHNMAKSRVGDLFGTTSNSFLLTFTTDYVNLRRAH